MLQEKHEIFSKSAQEEAKKSIRKCENEGVIPFDQGVLICQKLKIVKENEDTNLAKETSKPLMFICISDDKLQTYAFINSGIDGNKISYELYIKS